jgi:hypothetical protein
MATLRAGNPLGWPPPPVLSGSQDPAGGMRLYPTRGAGEPPSQNQPNRIGWEGVSEIEPWRCCTHRVRTTLSRVLYPRRLQKTYHAAGGGCRNRACQVRSWSFEEAGLDLDTGGRLDRLHIRVHLRWVSRWARRLLVVTGARCPLTKPVVTAVEQQAATEPHCSRGAQPGGICDVYVVQRGPTPGGGPGSGSGLRPAPRPQALPGCQLPLPLWFWFYIGFIY